MKELQSILRQMIDTVVLHGDNDAVFEACESIVNFLFIEPSDRIEWLQGCLTDDVLEYLRVNGVVNWVDNPK